MNQVNTIVLTQDAFKATTEVCSSEVKQVGKWKKLGDSYLALGINGDMLGKPSKGEANPHEKLHNQIEDAIKLSFSEHVQKVLAKDTKTLSDVDKETKRYWVRQVSSLFNKIRSHVIKAEAEPVEKTPRVPTTKAQRAKDKIAEAIKIIKSIEKPDFSVVDVCKALQLQIATIK